MLISAFYLLVVLILLTRLLSLSFFIRFFDMKSGCRVYAAEELDTVACYLKAILGVQQMASMIELSLEVENEKRRAA